MISIIVMMQMLEDVSETDDSISSRGINNAVSCLDKQ